jgi:hypothetical protein
MECSNRYWSASNLAWESRVIVVWTVGRTGGTATTVILRRLLGRRQTHHEPLNTDQIWGDLTREHSQAEVNTIVAALAERLTEKPIIKHCVETVPVRVTEGLVKATVLAGYCHVILIRRNEQARIMSWLLMSATGAASRADLDALSSSEVTACLDRLTKGHLVKAAAVSAIGCDRLNRVKSLLEQQGARHRVVAYEDVFLRKPEGRANPAFRGLLRFLEIDPELEPSAADKAFLDQWLIKENQNSARLYPEIERRLGPLPRIGSTLAFDASADS